MDYNRIHLIYKAKDREDADIFEEEALNYLCGCGNAKVARVAIADIPTDGWEEATLLDAKHVGSGVAHMRDAFAQTRNIFHYGNATVTYGRTYPGCFDKAEKRHSIKLPALEFIAQRTKDIGAGVITEIDSFIKAVGKTKRDFTQIWV